MSNCTCASRRFAAIHTGAWLTLLLAVGACGGGGAGSDNTSEPPPPVANCPTNKVAAGSVCQCPAGLVENPQDGFCTDPGGTVLRGAEYLEPGFPVLAATSGGFGFLPIYTKVGNIDDDPELEIFHKHMGTEFLAWNHDGTVVPGYSVYADTTMHGKMLLAQLDGDANDELFIGHEGTGQINRECELNAFDGVGQRLPGYPVACPDRGSITVSPVAVDFDDDGVNEILFTSVRNRIRLFRNPTDIQEFGTDLQVTTPGAREYCGLAAGELDGVPGEEVVALTCPYDYLGDPMQYQSIYAFDASGAELQGFPAETTAFRGHQPLLGDVDGDGSVEIVVVTFDSIAAIRADGVVDVIVDRSGSSGLIGDANYPFLALADVDGNGVADILFQQRGINAFTGSGTALNGFPVDGEIYFAVGDVDGDNAQEIVTFQNAVTQPSISPVVHLVVYESNGSLADLEVTIDQVGDPGKIMPTIADIDLDGRNEVIVTADYWTGTAGDYYKAWVFDFGGAAVSGPIEWGEKYGNRHNTGAHASAID